MMRVLSTALLTVAMQVQGGVHALGPQKTMEIKVNESVALSTECSWAWLTPVRRAYTNKLSTFPHPLEQIVYKSERIHSARAKILFPRPGTFYLIANRGDSSEENPNLSTALPPYLEDNVNCYQIVVRESDSYLGFLTELLGVPFVLPPKRINYIGHQTDLRLGTDCAELAIYAKRRQGFRIPYVGPRGIVPYLDSIADGHLQPGDIVHFAIQVCVLYRDRDRTGFLDPNDMFIQADSTGCRIVSYVESGFFELPFRLFRWKEEYQMPTVRGRKKDT